MQSGCTALNGSVLVLNRSYMAVHVVSVKRAFTLLFREAADVIDVEEGQYAAYDIHAWREISEYRYLETEGKGEWISTVDVHFQPPRVIRLCEYDRAPKHTLRFNRRNLLARDGHRCQYCGRSYPHSQLSLDHVLPRSRGGETSWENIVTSCVNCNTTKGNRTPREARMKLKTIPRKPKHSPLLAMKLSNPKYEIWKIFLPKGTWMG